jgi:hypothetical protein
MKMPNLQQFDAFQNFLITSSNETTVQYYSQDVIENMKMKFIIRRINTLTGKAKPSKKVKTEEISDDGLKKKLSKIFQRVEKEDEEYMEYEATFQWQQKIFSPREIVSYYKKGDDKIRLPLHRMYKNDIEKLLTDVTTDSTLNSLDPYCQQEVDRENRFLDPNAAPTPPPVEEPPKPIPKKRKKKKKKRDPDEEEQIEPEEEQIEEEPEEEQIEEKKDVEMKEQVTAMRWGANGVQDLLRHRLSTIVHNDGFYTDAIQKPIPCDSKHDFPEKFPADAAERKNPTPAMYIVANFGKIHRYVTHVIHTNYPQKRKRY